MNDVATTVTLAIEDATAHVASEVRTAAFRRYLRTSKQGLVKAGDEWTEVVNDGCGSTTPVTMQVVSVESGSQIGDGTSFEFELSSERD